jgi:outer membrane protein OmpA-like peptidoglycan-associated protein
LFLESRYRIENRRLESENRVIIEQLDLGRRIESDKATTLPVLLAVALLKDRKGEIRIDLPVTGRTDDPQFSAWRVARDILKNLLVTAVKSPFALLQSLFGTKEELSSVSFDYGSAGLSTIERDKLLKLATVLDDRPGLKIDVTGFVDKEHEYVVGEQQLRNLADARAAVVREFLVKQGNLESERVYQKSGDMYRAPAKVGERGSRVEFGVVVE